MNGNTVQAHTLFFQAHKMHFDPTFSWIVERIVLKTIDLKITVEFTIDTLKKIDVECCGYTLTIVISAMQYLNIFF